MSTDWLGYGYAALITIGGVVGYAKAGNDVLDKEVQRHVSYVVVICNI